MKLRLQSNSIRLRLKRAEVDQLASFGRVEEQIVIGAGDGDVLFYAIQARDSLESLRATLQNNRLEVDAPTAEVAKWASSSTVEMTATLSVGQGRELSLLIEKDFACLNGTEEQNLDTFPNPLAGTKC